MKKILILFATIVMFTSCDKYNYQSVYSVKDENDNVLYVDTLYSEGNKNARLFLISDVEHNMLKFDDGYFCDLLLKTKQKVEIISFEQLNKVE